MTTTIYQQIANYLKAHTWAKERRFRKRAIKELLLMKYPLTAFGFAEDKLEDFADDWLSYDRVFRLVQEENEDLQGLDYEDGKALSQEFQVKELGKEVGYEGDVRKLGTVNA